MKAREWIERGKNSDDPIDAFTNYWLAFNSLFFDEVNGDERAKIKAYLRKNSSEITAAKLLASHPTQIDYLLSQPVIDMRGNGKDTGSNVEAFNTAADSLTKLEELFMIIYQVRCNLMHGQKSPSRERDITLCQSALCILTDVVPT